MSRFKLPEVLFALFQWWQRESKNSWCPKCNEVPWAECIWILFYGLNVLCTNNYSQQLQQVDQTKKPKAGSYWSTLVFFIFKLKLVSCFCSSPLLDEVTTDHESLPCLCLILPSRPIMRKGVFLSIFDYHLLCFLFIISLIYYLLQEPLPPSAPLWADNE